VDAEVPRVLSLLWGQAEGGRRGPKPALTLERIGRAAIELADAHGLAAVSMKRVAEAVGVSTMALYRYVDTKDDLLTVMLEFASVPAPDLRRRRTWRSALEAWCRAYRDVLLAHPWMLDIPVTEPPATPEQLRWMEAMVLALDGTGLTAQEQTGVLLQLNVYVRGDVALSNQVGEQDDVSPGWVAKVLALADPADYPGVFGLLGSGEFDEDDDPAEQFEFGLQRTLDGIALLVERRSAG
jgi:AcrR family transcriptional regulator